MPRARAGTVEAVEDVREVVVGEARAVVAHAQRAVGEVDVDGAPGGLHLRALSSRFETARLMRSGSPRTTVGSSVARKRRRPSVAPLGALDQRRDDVVEPHVVERVARAARRARARPRRRRARSARRAPRRCRRAGPRAPPGGRRSASSSTWTLARRLAIGVRSSWLASATRCRCASTERSSASSVALKLRARRASSSSPSTSSRCERSGLAISASVRRVKRAIGASAVRADERAEGRGQRDAADADGQHQDQAAAASASSTSVSGRATCTAPRSAGPDREHAQVHAVDVRVARIARPLPARRSPALARRPAAERGFRVADLRPRRRTAPCRRRRRTRLERRGGVAAEATGPAVAAGPPRPRPARGRAPGPVAKSRRCPARAATASTSSRSSERTATYTVTASADHRDRDRDGGDGGDAR